MANPYVINFENLSLGEHHFTFQVDQELFAENSAMELVAAGFAVEMLMIKSANMMDLHFQFDGSFTVPCDRCNADLDIPIHDKGTLVVKYGQPEHQDYDEMIVLAANEYQFDLTHYLYESLCLLMPQRRVHNESECDPAFLKLLEKAEHPETESTEDADPRWDKLKQIK